VTEKKKESKVKKKKETLKLPIDFKKKWLKALRSGEFIQTIDHLATKDTECRINVEEQEAKNKGWGYCVLGVAAKIAGHSDSELNKAGGELLNSFNVPDILKQNIEGSNHSIASKLISMNDDSEKTFPKIADWIEKNL
jgi:hypothetical protein